MIDTKKYTTVSSYEAITCTLNNKCHSFKMPALAVCKALYQF